jgi:hypothetical protein
MELNEGLNSDDEEVFFLYLNILCNNYDYNRTIDKLIENGYHRTGFASKTHGFLIEGKHKFYLNEASWNQKKD